MENYIKEKRSKKKKLQKKREKSESVKALVFKMNNHKKKIKIN